MRAIIAALAVLGGGFIVAALGVSVAGGGGSEVGWILVGPLPFYAVALAGFLRRPGQQVVWWLVGLGAAFATETVLGDLFLPMAENHWGASSSITATIALVRQWAGTGSAVSAIGLIGLFPSGRPERTYERVTIWTFALLGLLVPLLGAVTADDIAMGTTPTPGAETIVRSSLAVQALAPLGGAAEAAYHSYPFWSAVGVVLLVLRYRRTEMAQRRQIRWLLCGVTVSFALWVPFLMFAVVDEQSRFANVAVLVLSPVALITALGALVAGLFTTGVFGIDVPARRAVVHRVLRVAIIAALAAVAATAGVLASLIAPAVVAVLVAVVMGVAGQGVRRRLEHGVDRWVLGARLAGYANLSRFGESLTRVPGSADLLGELAGEVRRGLGLRWVRVVLAAGPAGRMAQVAGQAVELAASRGRIVAGQDAERRRIQRVLHDGVQQEIVALAARAGLVRARLLRGDPAGAAVAVADMQRDLATALADVREIAYEIHPPVLSDRGLLEAIEAQAGRLAVPMAVRADPGLRGVRFGGQVEATAWYVVSEALANVVKHARAAEVEVSLGLEGGGLALAIRDDGCGFDPGRPRGLGLIGLSDRLATVGGTLAITSDTGHSTTGHGTTGHSTTGHGTTVRVHIPVDQGEPDG